MRATARTFHTPASQGADGTRRTHCSTPEPGRPIQGSRQIRPDATRKEASGVEMSTQEAARPRPVGRGCAAPQARPAPHGGVRRDVRAQRPPPSWACAAPVARRQPLSVRRSASAQPPEGPGRAPFATRRLPGPRGARRSASALATPHPPAGVRRSGSAPTARGVGPRARAATKARRPPGCWGARRSTSARPPPSNDAAFLPRPGRQPGCWRAPVRVRLLDAEPIPFQRGSPRTGAPERTRLPRR